MHKKEKIGLAIIALIFAAAIGSVFFKLSIIYPFIVIPIGVLIIMIMSLRGGKIELRPGEEIILKHTHMGRSRALLPFSGHGHAIIFPETDKNGFGMGSRPPSEATAKVYLTNQRVYSKGTMSEKAYEIPLNSIKSLEIKTVGMLQKYLAMECAVNNEKKIVMLNLGFGLVDKWKNKIGELIKK